jgi:hypothetical protein
LSGISRSLAVSMDFSANDPEAWALSFKIRLTSDSIRAALKGPFSHDSLMTNRVAKRVLNAYRPGNREAREPFFREALEQVMRSPKLGKWFVLERVIDDAVVAKLQGIEPPPGLKLRILARLRARHARDVGDFSWRG